MVNKNNTVAFEEGKTDILNINEFEDYLYLKILNAVDCGIKNFIYSGGLKAETVYLKILCRYNIEHSEHPIRIIAILPYPKLYSKSSSSKKLMFQENLSLCHEIIALYPLKTKNSEEVCRKIIKTRSTNLFSI